MTPDSTSGIARCAGYAALALALLGLTLIGMSDSECRFVGRGDQDYSGGVTEPGNTGGILAFTLAPLLAMAALIVLVREGRHGRRASRATFAAVMLVFPFAALNFIFFFVKGSFACGLGLL